MLKRARLPRPPIDPEIQGNGKIAAKDCARRRDSERSRRKAAALGAEITQEGRLSFFNRFSELQRVLKNVGGRKALFDKLRNPRLRNFHAGLLVCNRRI